MTLTMIPAEGVRYSFDDEVGTIPYVDKRD